MAFDLHRFSQQKDNRPILVIPTLSECDHQYKQAKVQPILAKAAEQLIASGRLWKWLRYTGEVRLATWNEPEKKFIFMPLADFIGWVAKDYRTFDSDKAEWLGPAKVTADRLIQAILKHPALPVASFQLQDERRRSK